MSRRVLLVDDEALSRLNLRQALAEHPGWEVAAECASAAEARHALAACQPDLIFLDIQMPQESGLSLARELAQADEPPLVIFGTAYDSYAIAAFEVHALDYLLKPFDDQRLAAALERATAMLEQRQRARYAQAMRACLAAPAPAFLSDLHIRSIGRIDRIAVDELLWIESAGNYVELHLPGRSILHRVAMRELEARLDPASFVRVHRRVIARRSQCASLQVAGDGVYRLLLRDGSTLPVSSAHLAAVRAALGL